MKRSAVFTSRKSSIDILIILKGYYIYKSKLIYSHGLMIFLPYNIKWHQWTMITWHLFFCSLIWIILCNKFVFVKVWALEWVYPWSIWTMRWENPCWQVTFLIEIVLWKFNRFLQLVQIHSLGYYYSLCRVCFVSSMFKFRSPME